MAIDRQDVLRTLDREAERRRLKAIETFSKTTAPLRELVSHPLWNLYVNKLAEWATQAEALVVAAQAKLCDPTTVNHDELLALKLKMAYEQGKRDAYRESGKYPETLINEQERLEKALPT